MSKSVAAGAVYCLVMCDGREPGWWPQASVVRVESVESVAWRGRQPPDQQVQSTHGPCSLQPPGAQQRRVQTRALHTLSELNRNKKHGFEINHS